jgi:hypothetical protein
MKNKSRELLYHAFKTILKGEDNWTLAKIDKGIESTEEIYKTILFLKNLKDKILNKILLVIDDEVLSDKDMITTVIKKMYDYQEKNEHNKQTENNDATFYLDNKTALIAEFLMQSNNVKKRLFKDIFEVKYDEKEGKEIHTLEKLIIVFCEAIVKQMNDNNKITVKIRVN